MRVEGGLSGRDGKNERNGRVRVEDIGVKRLFEAAVKALGRLWGINRWEQLGLRSCRRVD